MLMLRLYFSQAVKSPHHYQNVNAEVFSFEKKLHCTGDLNINMIAYTCTKNKQMHFWCNLE